MKLKSLKPCCALLLSLCLLTGCTMSIEESPDTQNGNTQNTNTLSLNADGSGTGTSGTTGGDTSTTEAPASIGDYDIAFSKRDLDASYEDAVSIDLDTLRADGAGVTIDGNVITITAAGSYLFTGSAEARIVVNAGEEDKVQLIFAGASLQCEDFAPLYILSADKVFLTLAEGTENVLSDGASYASYSTEADADKSSVDAAIFSRADLTINGSGRLTVTGSYAHGVVSKDDLVIVDAALSVSAVKTGINGKDCVKIGGNASISVNAGSDGIKSDNEEDAARGFVYIENGSIAITAGFDGIQAQTMLLVAGGTLSISTGGGSANASTGSTSSGWGQWGGGQNSSSAESSDSAKGLKTAGVLYITGGTISIDSSDDSLHSDGDIEIHGGTLSLSSGDDGVHANDSVTITGGTISIAKSYEGIEGSVITVTGGNIDITASDDGFNAAGGNDSSGMNRMGGGMFDSDSGKSLTITGGLIVVNAGGDGLDSNGTLTVSGGIVLVSGPTNSGNGALDYGTSAAVTGGYVIAAGSSGMAENFGSNSTQGSILLSFSSQSAGTRISLCDANGNVILSWTPEKEYSSVVFSAPGIVSGESYTVYAGGTASAADENGFANSGTLTGGTALNTLTMSSLIYSSGGSMGGGNQGGNMGGGRR